MNVEPTALPDVKIITPTKHGDHRGFFSETYHKQHLAEAGVELDFVQDNHSLSAKPGVLRGLHYQIPPKAQAKLVRVLRGAILDVAVDIRRGSATFGQHVTARVSAENWQQILIPVGFAHGFLTLEPDTEVLYKVTEFYAPEHERGIMWNDPALRIDWGIAPDNVTLSERDTRQPPLTEATDLFD